MASFLEDVGRAQPFQTFTQGVSKIRSDIQAREINDQTRRINEIKIQETQKQIARDNRVITQNQFTDSLGDAPQIFKDLTVQTFKRRGFMDAEGNMTGASQANMLKFINTDQGTLDTLGVFSQTAAKIKQDISDIDRQIVSEATTTKNEEGEDVEKSLSPKDIKALRLRRKKLVQQESLFANGIKSLGGIVDTTEQKVRESVIAGKITGESGQDFLESNDLGDIKPIIKARSTNPAPIVTWVSPDGKSTVNLKQGELPPEGYTKAPTVSIRKSVGDPIDDAMPDLLLAWQEENPDKELTGVIRRDLRQQAANNIKREGVQQASDKTLTKEVIKVLPQQRTNAQKAFNGKKRINTMLSLLDSGVTGKPGEFKKALAGWLEFAPDVSPEALQNFSEAQTFHLLGRIMTGPMRLDIVGPGPVTEYEQSLWERMSGGGGAAEDAARTLLNTYIEIADETVDIYHDNRSAAMKGNPNIRLQFQRVGEKSNLDEDTRRKRFEELKRKKSGG